MDIQGFSKFFTVPKSVNPENKQVITKPMAPSLHCTFLLKAQGRYNTIEPLLLRPSKIMRMCISKKVV